MDAILERPLKNWWYYKLNEGLPYHITCAELRQDFYKFFKENNPKSNYLDSRTERSLACAVGLFLDRYARGTMKRRLIIKGMKKQQNCYCFPEIDEARKDFQRMVPKTLKWTKL